MTNLLLCNEIDTQTLWRQFSYECDVFGISVIDAFTEYLHERQELRRFFRLAQEKGFYAIIDMIEKELHLA